MEAAVEFSIKDAQHGISSISDEIIQMPGMSGTKTRHFYNNLLKYIPNPVYLEIGTWKGSSVCSAMYNNVATVVCIDNWSEFDGPKKEFLTHFEKFKGANFISFIEKDCFKVNISTLPTFNIFMYDGNHSEESHYKALVHYIDCMENTFVYVVDDWNWEQVRKGTKRATHDLGLKVTYEKEIRTSMDESVPPEPTLSQEWWNGIGIYILEKGF
jgi:hypothetical protein